MNEINIANACIYENARKVVPWELVPLRTCNFVLGYEYGFSKRFCVLENLYIFLLFCMRMHIIYIANFIKQISICKVIENIMRFTCSCHTALWIIRCVLSVHCIASLFSCTFWLFFIRLDIKWNIDYFLILYLYCFSSIFNEPYCFYASDLKSKCYDCICMIGTILNNSTTYMGLVFYCYRTSSHINNTNTWV